MVRAVQGGRSIPLDRQVKDLDSSPIGWLSEGIKVLVENDRIYQRFIDAQHATMIEMAKLIAKRRWHDASPVR